MGRAHGRSTKESDSSDPAPGPVESTAMVPVAAHGAPGLDRRRRPGGQRSVPPPPGDHQSTGPGRRADTPCAGPAARPPLRRRQRRVHHAGARSPGRPGLAPRPRPLVEPVRRGRLATGRRDAERSLLSPHPGAGRPAGLTRPAAGRRGGHRLVHLLPGPPARCGQDVGHRGRGGLRPVRDVRLVGPRPHPAGRPAPPVSAGRGAGHRGGPGASTGGLATAGRGPGPLRPGRISRDESHRRGVRGLVGRAPTGGPRPGRLAVLPGPVGRWRGRRGGPGRPPPRRLRRLPPLRVCRRPQRGGGPRLAAHGRAHPAAPSLLARTRLRLPPPHRRPRHHHRHLGLRRGIPVGDPGGRGAGGGGRSTPPIPAAGPRRMDRRLPAPHLRVPTRRAPPGVRSRDPAHRLLPLRGPLLGARRRRAGRPRLGRPGPEGHPSPGVGGRRLHDRGRRSLGGRDRMAAHDRGGRHASRPRRPPVPLPAGQRGRGGAGPRPAGRRRRPGRGPGPGGPSDVPGRLGSTAGAGSSWP